MTASPEPPATASPDAGYAPTEHTTPTRYRDRTFYDRALVHSILDEAYVCHLGFVRDDRPVVLPTLYARVGERLYLHGSTGARAQRMAGEKDPGLPVCVTVTHIDGLVLARSSFHHSVNYRSVVIHGTAVQLDDPAEKQAALDSFVDHVVPGRAADSRRANAKELAATSVLALDLEEVSARVREGGPDDDPEDLHLPHWTGLIPLTKGYGAPVPADTLAPGIEIPGYLRDL
ncbi:pyridoxamine 5'-phosphate oxidase family protein [Actinomycetota bacterium Odt1-20B]